MVLKNKFPVWVALLNGENSNKIYKKEDKVNNMKKYILFDNDGVLVDTEMWYYRASAEVLSNMGISIDETIYREIMINGLSTFVLAEQAGFKDKEIKQAKSKRDELYQQYLRREDISINGVQEILKELKQKYKMAIVTTSRRVDFEIIHARRGIVEHMEFVLCVEDYARSKPHPDPYLKGLEKFNASKDETIVVEDSQRGLRSAVASGIECIVVKNDFNAYKVVSRE